MCERSQLAGPTSHSGWVNPPLINSGNGAASPFFSSGRGLRQGCPLSPLLFLLVAEGLSRALISAINTGDFQGIKTSPDLRITHLLFVDDVLIFSSGRPRDVETLAAILQLFQDATGMIINSQKSTLSLIGIDEATATLYKTLFPYPITGTPTRDKISWLPTQSKQLSQKGLEMAIGKIRKTIISLELPLALKSRKTDPYESCSGSYPSLLDVSLLDPQGCIRKNPKTLLQVYLVRIEGPLHPPLGKMGPTGPTKSSGGLGLKNIFIFSKALAAKTCWRLITTDSLWTQVVTHKYIKPGSVGDWIRRENKNIPNCSIIWKVVIKSFHVIGDGLAWKIGRGDKLRIGSDPWPGSGLAHSLSQELQDHLHTQGLYKLNQIVDPGSTNIWHQGWHSVETLGLEGDLKISGTTIYSHSRGTT
jgi:hypothetical protein